MKRQFSEKLLVATILFVVTLILAALAHSLLNLAPSTGPDALTYGARLRVAISLLSLIFIGGIIAVLILPISDIWIHPSFAALVGLHHTILFGVILHGTPLTPGGYVGDAHLAASSIVEYMTSHSLVDFNYKDLPAFYPPLYFYITGKLAFLFGIEPVAAPKFGIAVALIVIPFLLQSLWMKCTSPWTATAMLLVLFIPGYLQIFMIFTKPYEILSIGLFLPWWLHYVEGISADESGADSMHDPSLRFLLTGGFLGGLIFMTYYYPFFFGGIALLIAPLLRKITGGSAPATSWKTRLGVLSVAATVSSIYWLPLLLSMIAVDGGEPLQNRWFREAISTPIPAPFISFSIVGFISAMGLVYLIIYTPHHRLALAISALILSMYLWFAAGLFGVFYDIGLLIHMVAPFMSIWMFCAGILGIPVFIEQFPRLNRTAFAIICLLMLLLSQSNELILDARVIKAKDPQAYTALQKTPTWAIDHIENPSEQVIVSDIESLSVIAPAHLFANYNDIFSHPSGLHTARLNFLESLSHVTDPRLVAAASVMNRYSPIDYFLLSRQEERYHLSFVVVDFPDGADNRHIFFSPSVFAEPYFTVISSPYDNVELITLHADQVPLSHASPNDLSTMSYEWLLVTYQLYSTFGEHITPEYEPKLRELRQMLLTRRAEATSLSAKDQQTLMHILRDTQ